MLVAGTTFLVTDDAGDVPPGSGEGLFVADTRHLATWELRVDGRRLRPLTVTRTAVSAETVLAPPARRGEPPPYVLVRTQALDASGLAERLRIRNLRAEAAVVEIRYEVSADFADQFELRGSAEYAKPGAVRQTAVEDGSLVLRYRRESYAKRTVVTPGGPGRCDRRGVLWQAELEPHEQAELTVRVSAGGAAADVDAVVAARQADLDRVVAGFALPAIDDPVLRRAVHSGLDDLATLMIPAGREQVPGAGAPWFLTLFGRDSLITALAALPCNRDLAAGVLRALAACQGTRVDPARCEEPGRIVHEVRAGELSRFGQVPFERFYGTVDATPLFLILLGECGDAALAAELEAAARAAAGWVLRGVGAGYLTYRTDGPGLVHHCWKDSADSIVFASGEPAEGPIAVAEAQGYAYRGLRAVAKVARDVWRDRAYADELTGYAEDLRDRFAEDFWLPERDFPALALDGAGRRVDLLASNAGHLLWSGILDRRQAEGVAGRLLSPEFFTGWGLRTVAAGQRPYHPLSYHRGGVWPHDTALAVAGLTGYGLTGHAQRLAGGLLRAAEHFGFRLPEVLAGFGDDEVAAPVPYPHACSPQAWAATAPLWLLG
ncbi:glycogen debranching N-terminal domain-containing protein [Amycolatopsis suaedae]|uniref:Aminotransferase n=1 Tax=Amycolatopsis suaedae TaxID=2510978 RepID=A0A4Q7JA92_9PSEU|nr:glycogen debranching N-terminal domain-containing protein [Amycolatopsis suaedae]RZQ63832.1 aminotransferase [Amycolatopsis suaedae]